MFVRAAVSLVFLVGFTAVNVTLAQPNKKSQTIEKGAVSEESVLPKEVSRAVKRAEVCYYLAGEFGGDNSDRDKEVTAALKRNKCLGVNTELRRLEVKYKDQPQVLARIKAAE
jgi:hypothetical protein